MPTLFYGLILLLAVAVVFAYFYLKRAQARDVKTTDERAPAATPVQPTAAPTATPADDEGRRDGPDGA